MKPAEYSGTLARMSLLGGEFLVLDGQQLVCPSNLQTRNDLLGVRLRIRGASIGGWKIQATHIKRMDGPLRNGWEALA
jgi:hypothetical protein